MLKLKSKANCHSRADPAAEPARGLGGQTRENLRNGRRRAQNNRNPRVKATTWGVTKCLRHAERTCHRRYIPCSLAVRLSALISSSFLLILPDLVISSPRLETKSPNRSS